MNYTTIKQYEAYQLHKTNRGIGLDSTQKKVESIQVVVGNYYYYDDVIDTKTGLIRYYYSKYKSCFTENAILKNADYPIRVLYYNKYDKEYRDYGLYQIVKSLKNYVVLEPAKQ